MCHTIKVWQLEVKIIWRCTSVRGAWGQRGSPQGVRGLSKNMCTCGPGSLTELINTAVILQEQRMPKVTHGQSGAAVPDSRLERSDVQGGKPHSEHLPCQIHLANMFFEGTGRWASVMTSSPFCTRENKAEIRRIPKEGRLKQRS